MRVCSSHINFYFTSANPKNVFGRHYFPGRALDMSERRRIIEKHLTGAKVSSVARELRLSHGCVSKIISRSVLRSASCCILASRYTQTGRISPLVCSRSSESESSPNESVRSNARDTKDASSIGVSQRKEVHETNANAVCHRPIALYPTSTSEPPSRATENAARYSRDDGHVQERTSRYPPKSSPELSFARFWTPIRRK